MGGRASVIWPEDTLLLRSWIQSHFLWLSKMHENIIHNRDELLAAISSMESPSVLLGNGFNMSLGVSTSYKSIFESLCTHDSTLKILGHYPRLKEKIEENDFNLECYQKEILGEGHRFALMENFYRTVLSRCRTRYKHKEAITFLENFGRFFTINYDPLLYKFLLEFKGPKNISNSDEFYKDIETVHSGEVNTNLENMPLKALAKRQVYEIASRIFKNQNKHQDKDKKMQEYFDVLKTIRKEKTLPIEDGFVIQEKRMPGKQPGYKFWDFNSRENQNIFYLHGALHIYKDPDGRVKKLILKKGAHDMGFINHIQKELDYTTCVFEQSEEDKMQKIKDNQYLKDCLERLEGIAGEIVIIGWSCAANDGHIVRALKQNQNLEKIYFSYYESDTIDEVEQAFSGWKGEIIFFNSEILPFNKAKRARRAREPEDV